MNIAEPTENIPVNHRTMIFLPSNAVRIQKISSIDHFMSLGLDFKNLRKAALIGNQLLVSNNTLVQ